MSKIDWVGDEIGLYADHFWHSAAVWQNWNGAGWQIVFYRYSGFDDVMTVDLYEDKTELLQAMREYEPDLRKWRKVRYGEL